MQKPKIIRNCQIIEIATIMRKGKTIKNCQKLLKIAKINTSKGDGGGGGVGGGEGVLDFGGCFFFLLFLLLDLTGTSSSLSDLISSFSIATFSFDDFLSDLDDLDEIASFSGLSDFSGTSGTSGLTAGTGSCCCTFLFDGVSAVAINWAAFRAAPLCGTIIAKFSAKFSPDLDFCGDDFLLLIAAALDLDFVFALLTVSGSESESDPSLLELEELEVGGFALVALEGGDLVFEVDLLAFLAFSAASAASACIFFNLAISSMVNSFIAAFVLGILGECGLREDL